MVNPPAPLSLAPDQKLAGVFVLRRELPGDGGAERVWLAHDEVLGKDVSLHFIPQIVRGDERAMSELRQEIKRNRQLIHPGILRVYDLVEENEWAAISMDWFEGESLAAHLQQRAPAALDPKEIEGTLRQVCQTLEDVHRIQIVHRGLNPRNIYVDAAGKVLIARFGTGRVIDDALGRLQKKEAGDRHLTGLSPQQLDGENPNKLDDIYALGTTVYELLAGQPPFSGSDTVAQIRRATPTPISERRAKLTPPGAAIPAAWEKTVAACLAKNPADRPQSAGEVARKLEVVSAPKSGLAKAAGAAPAAAKTEAPAPEPAAAAAAASAVAAVTSKASPAGKGTEKPAAETAAERAPETRHRLERESRDTEDAADTDELDEHPPDEGDIYPNLYDNRQRSMAGPAVIVALLVLAGAAVWFFTSRKDPSPSTAAQTQPVNARTPGATTPAPQPEPELEKPAAATGALAANSNKAPAPAAPDAVLDGPRLENPTGTPPATSAPAPAPDAKATAAPAGSEPVVKVPASPEAAPALPVADPTANPPVTPASDLPLLVQNSAAKPPVKAEPAPLPPRPAIALPTIPSGPLTVEQAQQTIAAAEKAIQEATARKKSDEAALEATRKGLEQKTKATASSGKGMDELLSQRQKHQQTLKAAEDAAREARQAAEERKREADLKARQLEEAQKMLSDWETQNKAKLAARDQAQAELQALQTSLEEKQRLAADSDKTLAAAQSVREKAAAALKQAQDDATQARMAAQKKVAEEAQRAAEAKAARDEQIRKEMEAMKADFEKRMKTLQEQLGQPAGAAAPATPEAPTSAATPVPGKATPAPKAATPAPDKKGSKKHTTAAVETPVPTPTDLPLPAEPEKALSLAGLPPPPAAPTPAPVAMTPAPTAPPAAVPGNDLALLTRPSSPPGATAAKEPDTSKASYESSLGLKFAPVGEFLVSVYLTRVKDFATFAKETNYRGTGWRNPGFAQQPTHPVVNVSWNDAMTFAKWLTERDRQQGLLGKDEIYRLPTDLEWSKAVGLPEEHGKTPEDRDMGVPDVYPWGTSWPPPPNSGNYTGEETGSEVAIKGYDDSFAYTSPVGSFPPNKFGLYDMGGNVWQWCMDDWNNKGKGKVLRGASWYNGAIKLSILSSCRVSAGPDTTSDNYGFRLVKVKEDSRRK